jgi:hypothetical protein
MEPELVSGGAAVAGILLLLWIVFANRGDRR